MKTVLVLGKSGMLGGYVATYLKKQGYDIPEIARIDAATISDSEIETLLTQHNPNVVINCIGLIKQRKVGIADMIAVNSVFPHKLAAACEKIGIPMIHPSTDCLFDGMRGKYTEADTPNATDIYGRSKALGEPEYATIVRTSIIGSERKNKLSLLEWVKSKKGQEADGYANHFWNGVTCLQFAQLSEELINTNSFWHGIRHYHSPTDVSKYELIQIISDIYELHLTVRKTKGPTSVDRTLRSVHSLDLPPLTEQIKAMWDFDSTTFGL